MLANRLAGPLPSVTNFLFFNKFFDNGKFLI